MSHMPVTFFYPCPPDLKEDIRRADEIDVDEDLELWNTPQNCRRRIWNLQTYARLKDAGYDVRISEELPEHGIVVVLPELDIKREFLRQWRPEHRDLLVLTLRADVVDFRSPIADAEVVQNGRFADDERTFHISHWPQPGLIPRDSSRGTTLERIVFKGDQGNLHEDFRSDHFQSFLGEQGITLVCDGPSTQEGRWEVASWHDYSEADLVLAVRKAWVEGGLRPDKPASKLINAWHAGVPALLGPEYAYRELRQSELDYIEISTIEEAMDAILRLKNEPELYQAMVEHGRKRARDFTPERITERWAEVLFERLPALAASSEFQLKRRFPLRVRQVWNYFSMPPTPFEFRKQLGYVYRSAKRKAKALQSA